MEPVAAAVADVFHSTHQAMREQIAGLPAEALNWAPAPETNSIAVLVIHALGSEADTLHVVRGLPSDRDRPSEFRAKIADAAELVRRLDEADRLLAEMTQAITAGDLATARVRPSSLSMADPQTGTYWLVQNCAHAREHLGQLLLTKQLYDNQR